MFLVLMCCAVAAHWFANWRAEVRWQRYCAEARARGVKLTYAEFVGPEIPASENFALLPIMQAAFVGTDDAVFNLPTPKNSPPPFHSYPQGQRIDFKAWAIFFRDAGFISRLTDSPPRDVLLALEHYAPQFKEWREWRSRPHCQFSIQTYARNVERESRFLFYVIHLFTLRLRAHLAIGDSPAAFVDFEDARQAYRVLESATGLTSEIRQLGLLAFVCSQVGESLSQPGWADAELQKLQVGLTSVTPWKDYQRGLSGQRITENLFFDQLASFAARREALDVLLPREMHWTKLLYMLIPSCVFRDNEIRQNQYVDDLLSRLGSGEPHFALADEAPSDSDWLNRYLNRYYFFLAERFAVTALSVETVSISVQTRLDQTRLAIALERFRLARGGFPETLAELVPEFITALPVDTFSQMPLVYRRQKGGTFLLYGVGRDRKDDGADPKKIGHNQPDDIWLYAPPAS